MSSSARIWRVGAPDHIRVKGLPGSVQPSTVTIGHQDAVWWVEVDGQAVTLHASEAEAMRSANAIGHRLAVQSGGLSDGQAQEVD